MCDFIIECLSRTDPAMKIGMHTILCGLAIWLYMHPCLKGNVREAWARAFSLLVLQILPICLQGLHVSYHTLACTFHVYKSNVCPVASRSLFVNIQVVTLLLGEFT